MEQRHKILVASPTYNKMKYCQDKFLSSIKNLSYLYYEILIVDNSRDNEYFEELKKQSGINVIKDDTTETKNIKRLISSRNKILDYAIKNNFDYVLMIDSDVIPPRNIIEELLMCKKDIVSGLYSGNFVVSGKVEFLPVAFKSLTKEEFENIKKQIILPDFIKSHADIRRHITKQEADSGELLEVLIPSSGCMLISRKVFEKVRYGLIDTAEMGNIKSGDDIYFILEARKLGFNAYCNTKLKCEHLIEGKYDKDEDGVYEHPMFK